ncbi:MAG: VanZ family protein [Candidatus Methylumidiphilus sp.]
MFQPRNIWLIGVYIASLAFLSLNPWFRPDSRQAIGFITWDLVDHAVAYGLMAFLLLSAFKNPAKGVIPSLVTLLLSGLLGLLLEFGQFWFSPGRTFSLSDAYANVFGSCLGVAAFWCVRLALTVFRPGRDGCCP